MKSVYIHIPFCSSICSYCDFPKFFYRSDWAEQYLAQLKKEIETYYQFEKVKTLYIGGGTPSALNIKELKYLFSILQIFDLSECIEFTFECNIENITEEKAILLKQFGVNRISIGVETFHSKYLQFLNRHHQISEITEKIKMLKKIGFLNINVDLIYALPNETLKEVEEDIMAFLKLDIPHISTYSLMIEPHTMLNVHNVEPIEEELDYAMYQKIEQLLQEHQFKHYEVSNFGLKGYESKHNLVYWNNLEYYGFGLGAAGYMDGERYENTRNWNHYLSGNYRKEIHKLSINETIENELILGLRKLDGISLLEFEKKYHRNLKEYSVIKDLLREGKLIEESGNIKIDERLIYISNQILYQLIGEQYE